MSDNHESGPVEASDVFYPEETAEPLKPTAELDEENTDEVTGDGLDESEVESELLDDADTDDAEKDAEESEASDDDDSDTEEETLYLELDGEEFNLDEIRDWKSGHMMQADYTKKTQALADERSTLDTERTAFNDTVTKVSNLSLELEALVSEDSDVDWAELKEIDPEEYINKKELSDKRKAKVAELKLALPTSNVMSDADIAAEQQTLITLMPTWVKDGKPTATYTKEVQAAFEYAKAEGYTDDYLNNLHDARHWKALVLLSKGGPTKSSKKAALEKKVKRAPLVTKPKKNSAKKVVAIEDVFYG